MSEQQKQRQRLMPYSEVCELLNRNYRTIWVWVRDGKFIEPVRVHGRTVGFKREEFEQWLADNS